MAIEIFSILFYILISIVIVFNYKDNNRTTLDMRKEQSNTSLRENHLKKSLEDSFENKVAYGKKYKIETLCAQAGLKWTYGEYKIAQLITAIILPILCFLILKNEYLTIVSFFLGFIIPNQIITIMKNKRTAVMDKQVGSFLQMVTERYSNTKDFAKAIEDCVEDFRGSEPFFSELRDTVLEMQVGVSTSNALKALSKRTGSKYLSRLGDYYSLALKLGTPEARNTLLKQSYYQYEEDRKIKKELKMATSGYATEAYIMIAFIPVTMVYNAFTNDDYIRFMTETPIGKIGMTGIVAVIIGCIWVVSSKLSAPID